MQQQPQQQLQLKQQQMQMQQQLQKQQQQKQQQQSAPRLSQLQQALQQRGDMGAMRQQGMVSTVPAVLWIRTHFFRIRIHKLFFSDSNLDTDSDS
jgi:hypothetical protein